MRDRLIDLIIFLLAIVLLAPLPAPTSWIKIAALNIQSNASGVGTTQKSDYNNQWAPYHMPEVLEQPDLFYPHPASASPSIIPDDEYLDKQWLLTRVQTLYAWQIASDSQDVLIAVLDTGIDQTHEDLAGKITASANFSDYPTASDLHGHGTHIAGIIAAIANNGTGIAGVAPNSHLLNVKVTENSSMVTPSMIAEGITWATDNGAKVINMSFILGEPTQVVEDAVDYAWSRGAVVVAASGSYAGDRQMYPACYSHCIAVTATDTDGSLTPWANHGDWIDVTAGGVDIYSTLPDNKYGYKSGTSMAAAYVSGIAGLLFPIVRDADNNGLLNDEVRYMIENRCDELGIISIDKERIGAQKDSPGFAGRGEHERAHSWIAQCEITY